MFPAALRIGENTSTVSSELLYSNIECDNVHPWTFAVHEIRVSPFQNPTVSPHHCGTSCTCFCPIRTRRRKLSATPLNIWTWYCVVVISMLLSENSDHHLMNP